MTRKTHRDLTAGQKAKLAALRGEPLEGLAGPFNLDPDQIDEWEKELERNAEAAFPRSEIPSSEAPTLPILPPRAKPPTLPTLPAIGCQTAVPQSPPSLKVPTFPTVPEWPSGPKSPTLPKAASGNTLDDDFWEDQTRPISGVKTDKGVATGATRPPRDEPSPTWKRKLLGSLFVGWREKHHAAKTSRELLKLFYTVAAAHPGLEKPQLYRQIVMARLGGTAAEADAVLARAAESFAAWPVERPLKFRDVVHYLAVSEYLASNDNVADWARENLGRVVASFVPDNL